VDIEHPKKFRKLTAARCRFCDRQFFYRRAGRPRIFCDHKCRQADFRHGGYADPAFPKCDESGQKPEVISKTSKVDLADRPSRWRIVAGPQSDLRCVIVGAAGVIRANARANAKFWDDAAVDLSNPTPPKTEEHKFSPEQQKRLAELQAQIPADLSIPAFLRRGPST
jgi:hypothetical protein